MLIEYGCAPVAHPLALALVRAPSSAENLQPGGACRKLADYPSDALA